MKFCQIRKEDDVLQKIRSHSESIEIMAYFQPDFCQFFDNILFPLQITELLIQLSNELRIRRVVWGLSLTHKCDYLGSNVRHVLVQSCNKPGIMR